jgi:hypothetical protein
MITRCTKTPFFSIFNKVLTTIVIMFLVVSLTVSFFGVPLVKATGSGVVVGIDTYYSGYASVTANWMYGLNVTVPVSAGGTVSGGTAYVSSNSGTANIKFVVCNGVTGAVIVVSDSVAVGASVSWVNFIFSSNIILVGGYCYFLFLISDSATKFYASNEFSSTATHLAGDDTNSYASPQGVGAGAMSGVIPCIYVVVGASVYAKVADGSPSGSEVSIIDMGKPFSPPVINYTSIDESVSLPFIYGHQYSFCAYGEGNSTVRWCNSYTGINYTVNPVRLTLYSPVNMTAYYTAGGTIFTGGNGGAQTGINFLSSGHGSLTWTVTTEPQLGDTGNTGGLGFYGGFITGDTISLVAVPDTGYTFSSFYVGTLPYSNSPSTFTFLTNTTVTVNFIAIGSGGGNKGGNILGAFGISDNYLAVGIYAICIIGLSAGFYYLHNTNIPFAVALGLIIATIMCNIINVLGIYTYPIDALTILSIIGIIIFMRH